MRVFLIGVLFATSGLLPIARAGIVDFLECQLCETVKPEGVIKDCNCEYETVNRAVNEYFVPILKNLTAQTYFRYFRVDLDRPCPFWNEQGQCANEACAVCECEDGEVPEGIRMKDDEAVKSEVQYGWVVSPIEEDPYRSSARENMKSASAYGDVDRGHGRDEDKMKMLQHIQDVKRQSDRSNTGVEFSDLSLYDWTDKDYATKTSTYVNLLKNPERYTGYSGPAAQRVWRAIGEENCFGDGNTKGVIDKNNDVCLEKRTFFRLMSGIQGSITTQVAKEYLDVSTGEWFQNMPLFVRAVGAHRERVENIYFAFLVVLRAIAKAEPLWLRYNFTTGVARDDDIVRELIDQLVNSSALASMAFANSGSDALIGFQPASLDKCSESVDKCKHGFDESSLFQASEATSDYEDLAAALKSADPDARAYMMLMLQKGEGLHLDKTSVNEKAALFNQFRTRFRNISRIMDCVSCEKCRVWGKLEILGLGTAIKLLLMPNRILSDHAIDSNLLVSRQEAVAIFNLLNQFAKSVEFASRASSKELNYKLNEAVQKGKTTTGYVMAVCLVFYCVVKTTMFFLGKKKSKKM